MVRVLALLTASVSVSGSYNNPNTPGNWNLPSDGGFGADMAKGLPEINVRYNYPASFLAKGQADLSGAIAGVPALEMADTSGADQMVLGLSHSARPKSSSFLKSRNLVDPLEIIPASVTGGLAAKVGDLTPYTFVLHPPEEAAGSTNQMIDALARQEAGVERSIESDAVAAKQALLNEELQKVHALVGASRRASFLQSIYRRADYEIALHAPSESRADVDSAVNSVLKVENAKTAKAVAADNALKNALLSAEISKISKIVAGASRASFMEPFVGPAAVQTAQQASLPNVITVDFQKGSSFLGAHGDNIPRAMPVLNIDIPVRTHSSAGAAAGATHHLQ